MFSQFSSVFHKKEKENERILVLSDLNRCFFYNLEKLKYLNYSICVVLGGIFPAHLAVIRENVVGPIYAVKGDRDFSGPFDELGLIDVNGTVVNAGETTIAGISGAFRYSNNSYTLTQEEGLMLAQNTPTADILLSHDSPFQRFGTLPVNQGLRGVSWYVENNKPKILIHAHHGKIESYKMGETQCFSCRGCVIVTADGKIESVF